MNPCRWLPISVLVLLTGCGVYESLGGLPSTQRHIQAPNGFDTAQVFDCAEQSVNALPEPSNWDKKITRKDLDAGVLQVGEFDKTNVIGFRAQVLVQEEAGRVSIEVKGAGPYYKDLGVDRAADGLADAVEACLASGERKE